MNIVCLGVIFLMALVNVPFFPNPMNVLAFGFNMGLLVVAVIQYIINRR